MRVSPISCFRPVPERAASFSAPPYDVMDDAQARAYVASHEASFLAIDRPETNFAPGQDPYAPETYAYAVKLLNDRVLDGTLVREEGSCLFAYRMSCQGHAQTGLVAAVSVDDVLEGAVLRHEQVREEKVRDRREHIAVTGAQTGPVLLAYPDLQALDVLIALGCTGEPLYDFEDGHGVRHSVWRLARPMAVEAICATFAQVPRAYVADGHHRLEACLRLAAKSRAQGEEGPASSFLALLFPASQMRVCAYNRVVQDANGLSEQGLVRALEAAGLEVGPICEQAVEPFERGTFGLYAFGSWRELRLADGVPTGEGPAEALDASVLQRRVLGPVLGIEDPTTDPRIQFVSGEDGASALERLAGRDGVGFSLFPTSVAELMAVADAGELMPPKSTWFAPKPRSGLTSVACEAFL